MKQLPNELIYEILQYCDSNTLNTLKKIFYNIIIDTLKCKTCGIYSELKWVKWEDYETKKITVLGNFYCDACKNLCCLNKRCRKMCHNEYNEPTDILNKCLACYKIICSSCKNCCSRCNNCIVIERICPECDGVYCTSCNTNSKWCSYCGDPFPLK